MAKFEIPPFLIGATCWSFLGYFYAERPPIDLLTSNALTSDDPWIVLAAVLEHSKRGDFEYIHYLKQWFNSGKEQGPDRACIHLTADAGHGADLLALKTLLEQGPEYLRGYAAEAAALVGQLWLVPSMLEAWKSVSSLGHHETIGFAISSLLESPGGPIAEKSGSYKLQPERVRRFDTSERPDIDEEEVMGFEMLVRNRYSELYNQFGDEVVLWEGEPFNVRVFAERMYALLQDPSPTPFHGYFIQARHKLETITGINCSGCYQRGVLQPLSAASVLKSILDNKSLSKYEPGVRYFFGHRIPD